ncbi:MAG: rod shape-determining protein MreD [Clostridia bacterium]|jgi:rod shape-determining protein MreD|nr:rod shape-determining protein MreD [Clostridia bacterium]
MKRNLLLFLMAFLALLLQTTVFNQFNIAGVKPDLILVLVICLSVVNGPRRAGVLGFSLGLLEDFYLGRFIGMNAVSKGAAAVVVGWFTLGAFSENLLVPIVSVFLGTVFNTILYFLIGHMLDLNWTLQLWLWNTIPLAIFNMCIVPFIYSRFYYFAQGLDYRTDADIGGRRTHGAA